MFYFFNNFNYTYLSQNQTLKKTKNELTRKLFILIITYK